MGLGGSKDDVDPDKYVDSGLRGAYSAHVVDERCLGAGGCMGHTCRAFRVDTLVDMGRG